MKISDFSIKRPVFTFVTMVLVILLGAVSLFKIPITLIPDLNPPIGVVVTTYPGASPTEVNEKVTKPLETSLATLPGINKITSTSQESNNLIVLEFDWSTSIKDVQSEVLQRLDITNLPDEATASFLKFDPSQLPIIQLSLRATEADVDVRQLAEQLELELKRQDGVASVNLSGHIIEEVQIALDAAALEAQGLTQADIVQIVQANNISLPGEAVNTDEGQLLTTRVISTFTSAEQIADLILSVNPLTGETIHISDIGSVTRVEQEQQTITRAGEYNAVLMSVLQESGTNTAQVSETFQEALNALLKQPEYANVQADILYDQGDYIDLAIDNISTSLIYGGLFAMLVLFIFLRGWKSPVIVGIAIPYSVIVTFVLLYFAEFSLNILTLGALAIGIGMLVDNAIVVIENIERHLSLGKPPKEAASIGTKEVGIAIIASTLTTVAVFVPVMFTTGLIGQLFTEFALTITFSLFASLIVALTVVPMLASKFLTVKKGDLLERRAQSTFYQSYKKSLQWAINHRWLVLVATLVAFVISCVSLFRTGTEFIPPTDEGYFSVEVALPQGTSLSVTEQLTTEVEERIKEEPEIDVLISMIGGDQQTLSRGTASANIAQLYVKLVPLAQRERSIFEVTEELEGDMQALIGERAEIDFSVSTAAGTSPNTMTFRLTDSNEVRLKETVKEVQQELEDVAGILEVTTDLDNIADEIQIEVDREKAQSYGMTAAQIAQSVNAMMRGVPTTQIIAEDGEVLSVYTGFGETYKTDIEAVRTMKLRSPAGIFVRLEEVADIRIAATQTSIRRSDQAAAVAFFVKYETTESLSSISEKIDRAIEQANMPDETAVVFSGDRELFENAKDDMYLAIALAVILVYIVMAAQFESLRYPFIMMFSVPLMVIGVAASLWLTQTLLGITVIIGILVLVGIVVNNGIVLVDYINLKKSEGHATEQAILIGAQDRLRPILMTALTTALGLVPLALGIGEGTELNQPMAIVIIGGLLTSTLLTLYIVPILYRLLDRRA